MLILLLALILVIAAIGGVVLLANAIDTERQRRAVDAAPDAAHVGPNDSRELIAKRVALADRERDAMALVLQLQIRDGNGFSFLTDDERVTVTDLLERHRRSS